jgi:hypothetical protein
MASARNATATATATTNSTAATGTATNSAAKARSSRSSSTAAASRRKASALQGLQSDGTCQRAVSVGRSETSRRDAPHAQFQPAAAGGLRTAEAVTTGSSSGLHGTSAHKGNVLSVSPTTSHVACSSFKTGSSSIVGVAGISATQAHKPIAAASTIQLARHEGAADSYEHSLHGEIIKTIAYIMLH